MNVKARALKQLNRIPEALAAVQEALRLPMGEDAGSQESYGVVLYNKVCYGLLLGLTSQDQALADLQESFRLFPRGRESAKTDSDLDALRQNQEFKRLIES
jgi:hypothetical protein